MRRVCFLLVVVSLPWLASAAEERRPLDTDYQDLVYFGANRPISFRVHLHLAGRPFRVAWDEFLQDLFHFLDRNGDGFLDKSEAESAPRAQALREILRSGSVSGAPGRLTLSQMDSSPADGKVSLDEFRR